MTDTKKDVDPEIQKINEKKMAELSGKSPPNPSEGQKQPQQQQKITIEEMIEEWKRASSQIISQAQAIQDNIPRVNQIFNLMMNAIMQLSQQNQTLLKEKLENETELQIWRSGGKPQKPKIVVKKTN